MSDSNLTPSPAERPQTLRVPVTRLVSPPQNKPEARLVPPEEPPAEPWEEDLRSEDGTERPRSANAHAASVPIQLPHPVNTARPAYGPPARTNTSPGASNLSAFSRPIQNPSAKPTPVKVEAAKANAESTESPVQLIPSQANPARLNPVPKRPAQAKPVPLMELKSVLPVDPARSGINVIAAPPRITTPAPRPVRPALPDLPEPVRVPAGMEAEEDPPAVIAPQPVTPPLPVQLAAPARPLAPAPAAAAASVLPSAPSSPLPPPTLSTLMEKLVNLPAQTAILGVCDDRLPVLIDLADPAPGALLVASDDEALRTRLLRTLLQTAAALNSPRSVQFLILSTRPAEWQTWLEGLDAARHCLGIDSLLDGNPDRWLLKLSGWADQRRTGSSSGPAVILVVDDLTAVPRMEYDARVNFDWLVKEGPGVRIWPVGALAVEETPDLARWVRLFKTRILGPAADPALYRQLAAIEEPERASLVGESQFAVRIDENWLKFRVPVQPGDEAER